MLPSALLEAQTEVVVDQRKIDPSARGKLDGGGSSGHGARIGRKVGKWGQVRVGTALALVIPGCPRSRALSVIRTDGCPRFRPRFRSTRFRSTPACSPSITAAAKPHLQTNQTTTITASSKSQMIWFGTVRLGRTDAASRTRQRRLHQPSVEPDAPLVRPRRTLRR